MKPNREAKKLAEEQGIEIKYYNIIYKALEAIQKSLSGLLEPDINEKVIGSAEILQIFKVSKAGKIAELLGLNRPIYQPTSAYGHFGRAAEDNGSFSWERLGFLPGDMKEKVDPYLRPLYDALYEFIRYS